MGEAGDGWGSAQVLDALGRLSVIAGHPERGARLLGAVDALCELTGAQILASERQGQAIATARAALGEAAFATAWGKGRGMRLEEAVGYALGGVGRGQRRVHVGARWHPLSALTRSAAAASFSAAPSQCGTRRGSSGAGPAGLGISP